MVVRKTVRAHAMAVGVATAIVSSHLAGCSSSSADDDSVTVFAAASLADAFQEIGRREEAAGRGHYTFSFDGSNSLVAQIASGAPADVLATADARTMGVALSQGLVDTPEDFTSNTLALIVPQGNPAGVTGLNTSLAHAKLVLCDEEVPCGAVSRAVLDERGLSLSPASREKNVGAVRSKVELGQADAGIVYVTDALRAGESVQIIDRIPATEAHTIYPIAVVSGSRHTAAAVRFLAAVRSPEGQEILARYGFACYGREWSNDAHPAPETPARSLAKEAA